MQAFHNDLKIKKTYLARIKAHAKADEIVKGYYWENGKGCAVGCTIHGSQHKQYEVELGIPEWLARVEDGLFEGMSEVHAKKWPERFLKAIKPGVDLEKAKAPFLIFVLSSVKKHFNHKKYPKALKSVENVIKLYSDGGTQEEFRAARAAAAAAAAAYAAAAYAAAVAVAAADAADAAAVAAAAAAAAYAAAYAAAAAAVAADAAAAYAAAYAAAAADAAAASRSAREKENKMFADKLIEILENIK